MIEEFLAASTWEDLVRYTVIAVVLAALSPYGIYFLRTVHAVMTGRPRPRIVRRSRTAAGEAISNLEKVATTRLQDMADHIGELQQNLDEALAEADRLQAENEALKAHIRGMESGPGSGAGGGRDDWSDTTSQTAPESDYAILGLRDDPLPTWGEIREAYRNLVKEVHPDQGGDADRFKEINAAYERLKERRKPRDPKKS